MVCFNQFDSEKNAFAGAQFMQNYNPKGKKEKKKKKFGHRRINWLFLFSSCFCCL